MVTSQEFHALNPSRKPFNLGNIWALFFALYFCSFSTVSNAEEIAIIYSFNLVNDSMFRGRKLNDDIELWSYSDFSWSGISVGINNGLASDEDSESQYESFISYSYATELFYFTGGFNYVDHFDISEQEVFLEVSGREDYFIFTPSVFISQELNGSRSYIEASVSRDVIRRDWLINPHASFSYGDYYSDKFEKNHFDFGIDVTKKIDHAGEAYYFTASLNAIKPLDAIDSATGDEDVYIQSSLGLLFKFD